MSLLIGLWVFDLGEASGLAQLLWQYAVRGAGLRCETAGTQTSEAHAVGK